MLCKELHFVHGCHDGQPVLVRVTQGPNGEAYEVFDGQNQLIEGANASNTSLFPCPGSGGSDGCCEDCPPVIAVQRYNAPTVVAADSARAVAVTFFEEGSVNGQAVPQWFTWSAGDPRATANIANDIALDGGDYLLTTSTC